MFDPNLPVRSHIENIDFTVGKPNLTEQQIIDLVAFLGRPRVNDEDVPRVSTHAYTQGER